MTEQKAAENEEDDEKDQNASEKTGKVDNVAAAVTWNIPSLDLSVCQGDAPVVQRSVSETASRGASPLNEEPDVLRTGEAPEHNDLSRDSSE